MIDSRAITPPANKEYSMQLTENESPYRPPITAIVLMSPAPNIFSKKNRNKSDIVPNTPMKKETIPENPDSHRPNTIPAASPASISRLLTL